MINDLIQLVVIFVLSLLASTNKHIGGAMSIILLFIIALSINDTQFYTKYIHKNPFPFIKGITVILPLVLYSNYYKIKYFIQLPPLFFTWVLFINILEVPFLIQFRSEDVLSHINGICTIILALYTPYILYNKNTQIFTFRDNLIWTVANLFILGSFYVFNSYYKGSAYVKLVLFSVCMPTVYSILVRDTELWIPLRIYSLALTSMIVSSTYLTDLFTGTSLDKILLKFTNEKYYKLRAFSVCVNVLISMWLIKRGTKDTLVGSLINGFT